MTMICCGRTEKREQIEGQDFWGRLCAAYTAFFDLTGWARVVWVGTFARSTLTGPSAVTHLLVFGHAVVKSRVAAAVTSYPVLITYAPIALTPAVTSAQSVKEKHYSDSRQ